MRLAWITDPHFNFVREPDKVWKELAKTECDAFLVTGDISEAGHLERIFQIWASGYKPIYFVLGNHDFYGSSIRDVRDMVGRVTNGVRGDVVRYLTAKGVEKLTESTALIGDDGWYDGRNGTYYRSDVELADFYHIRDFKDRNKRSRLHLMQKLADASADRIKGLIEKALEDKSIKNLIIATHVAPWAGAAWHMGAISDPAYLPFFSSHAMGALIEQATADTDVQVTVLCGHSHSGGTLHVSPNVVCYTGAAEYRYPTVHQVLDIK